MNNQNKLSNENLDKAAGGLTRESTLKETLPGLANDDTDTLKNYGNEHVRLKNAEKDLKSQNADLGRKLNSARNNEIAAQKAGNNFMNSLGF